MTYVSMAETLLDGLDSPPLQLASFLNPEISGSIPHFSVMNGALLGEIDEAARI
jgi:hypothetical protein